MVPCLVLAAVIYVRGWFRLHRLLPQVTAQLWPFAFLCGLLALWVAVASPLAALDEELLSAHMVQHLLLSVVAAPLILLGAPVLPLLYGTPRLIVVAGIVPVLRSRPLRLLGRLAGEPAFCWSVAVAVFICWHTPSLFQLALRSEPWHGVEHATFLGGGLLFWWPVVQPWPSHARWPRWSVPFYLFFATLPCDVLSAFLAFSDRVVYPAYLSAPRHFSVSALQDQEWAGALMWLSVTIAYVIPAAVITARVLSPVRPVARERVAVPIG